MQLVEITLTLHPSQRMGWNKWNCTIDGEQRIVTSDKVQFAANTFENLSSKFNVDECVDVNIHWSEGFYLNAQVIRVYHD
jgi:hypothetical protein